MRIDILRRDSLEWGGANDAIRASWKIWTLADIRAALTNQELALVVTWLRRSERRESETTMEDKIIITGHPELYDTSSYCDESAASP